MKRLILVCLLSLAACVDYRAIGLNIHPRPPAVVVQPPVIVEPPAPPVRATGAQLLDYKGCLGTLRDSANRVVWTPALPGAPVDVRAEWYQLLREAGCTHVPIGPFGPGPSYPGIVAWNNPDWLNDPAAIRGLVEELLNTPSADGLGFRPVIFTDGGPRNPKPRLQAFFPVLSQALEGLDDYVIVVPAGWEPVVGDFTSAEVSWALETWHAYRPRSLIGYHGSPGRLVGSSNCTPDTPGCAHGYEDDDPWKGGEAEFYRSHGGEFISIALYQTPHGDALYRPCDPDNEDGSCWANRFQDYVSRIGTGFHGWRVLTLVLFEVGTYETTHGRRPVADTRPVVRLGQQVCQKWNAPCGYGDGLP